MNTLPDRANLDHLRKQAKDLLRLSRAGDPAALAHFARFLPAASGRTEAEIAALGLRLHDAQSCVARQYGFPSWSELSLHVEAQAFARGDRATAVRRWLALAYGGDVAGSLAAARPSVAARMLRDTPELTDDVWVACAAGYLDGVSRAVEDDPWWVSRDGGPFRLPPLVAVTHSRLGALPEMREGLRACAARLLRAGADPNGRIFNRFPPASLATPDEHGPLSALYRCRRRQPRPGPDRPAARCRRRPKRRRVALPLAGELGLHTPAACNAELALAAPMPSAGRSTCQTLVPLSCCSPTAATRMSRSAGRSDAAGAACCRARLAFGPHPATSRRCSRPAPNPGHARRAASVPTGSRCRPD